MFDEFGARFPENPGNTCFWYGVHFSSLACDSSTSPVILCKISTPVSVSRNKPSSRNTCTQSWCACASVSWCCQFGAQVVGGVVFMGACLRERTERRHLELIDFVHVKSRRDSCALRRPRRVAHLHELFHGCIDSRVYEQHSPEGG